MKHTFFLSFIVTFIDILNSWDGMKGGNEEENWGKFPLFINAALVADITIDYWILYFVIWDKMRYS